MKSLIKKMVILITILTLIEIFVCMLFFGMFTVYGVLLGSAGALLNLYSMWYDIKKMEKTKRFRRSFLTRYTFNAGLFLVGGLISVKTLFGVFVGLLNLKISAYITGLWRGNGEQER